MSKSAILDRVEVDMGSGCISLRWKKLSSDGDMFDYHRTIVDPDVAVSGQVGLVEAHLKTMGFTADHADAMAKAKQIADMVRTKDVVDAFKAQRAAQIAQLGQTAQPPAMTADSDTSSSKTQKG